MSFFVVVQRRNSGNYRYSKEILENEPSIRTEAEQKLPGDETAGSGVEAGAETTKDIPEVRKPAADKAGEDVEGRKGEGGTYEPTGERGDVSGEGEAGERLGDGDISDRDRGIPEQQREGQGETVVSRREGEEPGEGRTGDYDREREIERVARSQPTGLVERTENLVDHPLRF